MLGGKVDVGHDPIEDDLKIRAIIEQVDKEVEKLLEHDPSAHSYGGCHVIWSFKKQILKERYGIEWRDPSELNPDILFD